MELKQNTKSNKEGDEIKELSEANIKEKKDMEKGSI